MRRLLVVACLGVSAACGEIPAGPTSPTVEVVAQVVTPTRISLVSSPGSLPSTGGTARIFIETASGSQPAPKVRVQLSSTTGQLSEVDVTTDSTGHARVDWTGTQQPTITARSGELTGTTIVTFLAPPANFPPDRNPPPPAPTPVPEPPPAPVPVPTVTLSATPVSVTMGQTVTLTATSANLAADETVVSYQWDFDGDRIVDATTVAPTQAQPYNVAGTFSPGVTLTTSQGRTATSSASVTVTVPTLVVRVTAPSQSPAVNVAQNYTATTSGLQPGESVLGYTWTFEPNSPIASGAVHAFTYLTSGARTVRAVAHTNLGRTATGELPIFVTP